MDRKWSKSSLTEINNINLNLIVAYDLKYSNTKMTDYTNLIKDILNYLESTTFINKDVIKKTAYLFDAKVINEKE